MHIGAPWHIAQIWNACTGRAPTTKNGRERGEAAVSEREPTGAGVGERER